MKQKRLIYLCGSVLFVSFCILFIPFLKRMEIANNIENNQVANELPPDYIEGRICKIEGQKVTVNVNNDESLHHKQGKEITLSFENIYEAGTFEKLTHKEIAEYISQFKIDENISVDFSISDFLDEESTLSIVTTDYIKHIND